MNRARSALVATGIVTALVVTLLAVAALVAAKPSAANAPILSPAPTTSTGGSSSTEGRSPTPTPTRTRTPTPSPTPTPTTVPQAAAPTAPYDILGLGDSVTSGSACSCDDYVTGLGKLLQARSGQRVVVDNEGEDGETAVGLRADLTDPDIESQVRQADLVVITIGANDLSPLLTAWRNQGCDADCSGDAVASMGRSVGSVVGAVEKLGRPTVIVTTYWNVFVDGDVGDQQGKGYPAWSDNLTRRANAAICANATAAGAVCADLYAPFKGTGDQDPTRWLADDGDHPNAAGTALISRTLLPLAEAADPQTSTSRSLNQPSTSPR